MALINRMSRLLAADVHAVLDRIEEPEAVLRQALREMEEEVERAEQHASRLEQEIEHMARRREKLGPALTELDAEIGLCFESGNEALARKLVRRKLQAERFEQHLADRLETARRALAARRATLLEQRERLDVVRQQAELATEASDPAAPFPAEWNESDFGVGEDEVEVAFLRERRRRQPS